jgi:superfamily II DNA/RNA helicase
LVTRLQQCADRNKILVFVETRNNARMLNKLLRIFLPAFNSTVVVGQKGFDGMSWEGQCGQKEALEQFAAGMCRLIICTSVLEEGLDVPDCDCVFRFGGRASLIQHIQSRGRARAKHTAGGRGKMVLIFTAEEEAHLLATQNQESVLDAALASVTVRLSDVLVRDKLAAVQAGDAVVVQTIQNANADERGDGHVTRQYCLKLFVASNAPSLQQEIVNGIKSTTLVSKISKVEVFANEAQSHSLASPQLFNTSDSVVLVSISTSCGGDFLHRFAGVWDFRISDR